MKKIDVKDIHRVTAKGRVYLYHRPTKTRILSPEGSPEFLAELAAIGQKTLSKAAPNTLGSLISAYKGTPKQPMEFSMLGERTRADYQKVFDYLKPIAGTPLPLIDTAFMLQLRDKAFAKRKRRFANCLLTVTSIIFNWGRPRKLCGDNPTFGVKQIARKKGTPAVNRPWSDSELAVAIKQAPQGLKSGILLALSTSMRGIDVVALPWKIYDGKVINATHGKNDEALWVPAHPLLKMWLDRLPNNPLKMKNMVARKKAMEQPIVLAPKTGKPYLLNGFRGTFKKFIDELETGGLVDPGLTFHGLRHSIATLLAEAGATTQQIMAVTGHRDEKTVQIYIAKANKKKLASQAMSLLNLPGQDVDPDQVELAI
jgi:integrase